MARKDFKEFIKGFGDKSQKSNEEDVFKRIRKLSKLSEEHQFIGGVIVKRGDKLEDIRERLMEEIAKAKTRAKKEGESLENVLVQDSDGKTVPLLEFERNLDKNIKAMLKDFDSANGFDKKSETKNTSKSVLRVPSDTLKTFDKESFNLYEQLYQALLESVAGFYDGQPKLEPLQKAMRLSLITMAYLKQNNLTKGLDNEEGIEALAECMEMFINIDVETHLIFVAAKKNLDRETVGYSVMGVPRNNTVKHIKKMIEEADDREHREAAQKALSFFEKHGNRVLN